ncbi:MAG: T9SS type A sorting domain-containing protein, partial [Saprospiraceae bacterium]|nr:T9SS type A sorting domain-containing protein [Saprospiraceae bacterium]
WSNGQSGAVATNLSQGNYTVTATDSNGDMATEDVTISQPSSPTSILIISQQDVSCNGGSDGSVQVQASGNNGGFSYQWSNGQNGPFIANLRANTYTVTATDIEGCEETMDIEITEPEELEAEVTTEDANCTVDSSGFASVRPEGGTPPYDYSWSNGYSSSGATSEQDSLTPGDYTVEILDDNDCLLEVMLTIGQDTGFAIEVVRIDTPDCHQGSDGAIEIEISGGTAPFDIEWDNGDTTLSISGLTAGSYYVEVTDADGCIDSMNVEVPDRAPNVIEILDSTTVDCPEDSTTVRFTYSGGGWNGPSGDTISITGGVDTHFYMLTDPRNCMQTDTIIITHDDTIAPVIACPGDTTTSSCTFSYSLPDVEENCDSLAYNVMEGPEPGEIFPAGITVVTIEVRDEAGNADTCTFEVNVLNDLELLATTIKEARCAGDTAIYRLNGSGGSGDLRVISQGDTMTLDGDSLIVEVTEPTIFQLIDTTGCFDEISVGPDLTPLMVDSANVTQMSGTGTNDGRIEIFVSGGTPDYAYLWKNDIGTTVGDSMVLDSLSPGSYYCIVMDSNLCTVTSDTFVIELITAVNGVEQNVVNVFPNPFDTRITVESSREPILSLTIYNSRGEKLARVETYDKKFSYEFGDMTTGIYFIAVETENDLLIRKVLRQR